MEPWREELYHYGIKGMRWHKRKKRSNLESAARNYEINARQEMEANKQLAKQTVYKRRVVKNDNISPFIKSRAKADYRRKKNYYHTTFRNESNSKLRLNKEVKKTKRRTKVKNFIKNLFKKKG